RRFVTRVGSRSQLANLWTQNGGYRVLSQQFPVIPIERGDCGMCRDMADIRVAEDASFGEVRGAHPDGLRYVVFQQNNEFVVCDCARLGSALRAEVFDLDGVD